jgi:hypothetical protein
MFMLVLAGFVTSFVRRADYSYYAYTILARTFIVLTLAALYWRTGDPLFLVLDAIVLVGLLPAMYVQWATGRAQPRV